MSDISEVMGGSFNPDEHEPTESFDPIPAGWYEVEISSAEVRKTKKNDGAFLKLELTVTGAQFSGRKIWKNINLSNPSAKAVEIGTRELAGLGQALGLVAISDSAELVSGKLQVKVGIEAREGFDPQNDVKAFKALDGAPAKASPAGRPPAKAEPAKVSTPPAASAAPATGAKKPRPWERK